MGLLCKIFGHKYNEWSIEFENSLVKQAFWYCERCEHKEIAKTVYEVELAKKILGDD